jgi:hypothetical protein
MNLQEALQPGGRGVLATASKTGAVNTAIYAMTDGRTWNNVRENPSAVYTYFAPGGGFRGVRIGLALLRSEDSGEMLAKIRERAGAASPVDPEKVTHVAYFKVTETRPLV